MRPMRGLGVSRGMRGMRNLKAVTPAQPLPSIEDTAKKDEERLQGWVERVGEARAQEALTIYRERTGSTTLPELLVEAALRKLGVHYRAQVDLGWSRPDFVVFDAQGAIIVRVQGDYWHSRPGAEAKDAAQRDRLERHTVFGIAVLSVVDVWERDIYESEAVVSRALGITYVRADGGVTSAPVVQLSYAETIMRTASLWGYWRLNNYDGVAIDETGQHPGVYTGAAYAVGPGRKEGELARRAISNDGHIWIADGVSVTDFTIEIWTRIEMSVNSAGLCTIGLASPNWAQVRLGAGMFDWSLQFNGTQIKRVGVPGAWMHLAVVRAGNEAIGYVDGRRVGVAVVPVVTTTADGVRIGSGDSVGGSQWIDEAALFTRALSDDEIWQHYAAG